MRIAYNHNLARAVENFCQAITLQIADATQTSDYLDQMEGYRFIRLIRVKKPTESHPEGEKSVYGFVEKTSGNIFRPCSWKAPSLNHVRGNVYDEHGGLKYCHWDGPAFIYEIANGENVDFKGGYARQTPVTPPPCNYLTEYMPNQTENE
jgi:hypothetical protein